MSIFRSLEHNASLEELDLSGNSQLAEGDSETVGCAIERMLNVNTTLKVLNLSECRFTSEVAPYFVNGLAQNHSVIKVILHSNDIGNTTAVSIFRSLEHNTSLEELNLSGNSQLAEGDSEAVGCAIERMLNVNRTLKVLNLSDCGFADEVATYFSNGLAQNCMVQKLVLCSNQTGSTGAVNIFRSLENNASLKELDLSGNQQLAEGDSEAVGCEIERMLNANITLTVLNLSGCRLGTSVATHIAAGLAQNASLAELHFGRYSGIASEGWVRVFKALRKNTSLKKLHISSSNVRFGVSVALAKMLSCNKSLIELSLWWCHIPEAGLREITRGLLQNTTLQIVWIGNTQHKTFLEAEIMRSQPQSSRKLEIK